jgi:hypothetical protein
MPITRVAGVSGVSAGATEAAGAPRRSSTPLRACRSMPPGAIAGDRRPRSTASAVVWPAGRQRSAARTVRTSRTDRLSSGREPPRSRRALGARPLPGAQAAGLAGTRPCRCRARQVANTGRRHGRRARARSHAQAGHASAPRAVLAAAPGRQVPDGSLAPPKPAGLHCAASAPESGVPLAARSTCWTSGSSCSPPVAPAHAGRPRRAHGDQHIAGSSMSAEEKPRQYLRVRGWPRDRFVPRWPVIAPLRRKIR